MLGPVGASRSPEMCNTTVDASMRHRQGCVPAYRTFISLLWIRGHCLRPKRLAHPGNPEKRPTVFGRISPTSGLSTLAVLVVLTVITDRISSIGRAWGPGLSGGHVPTPSQASSSPPSSRRRYRPPCTCYLPETFLPSLHSDDPPFLPSLPPPLSPFPFRNPVLSPTSTGSASIPPPFPPPRIATLPSCESPAAACVLLN